MYLAEKMGKWKRKKKSIVFIIKSKIWKSGGNFIYFFWLSFSILLPHLERKKWWDLKNFKHHIFFPLPSSLQPNNRKSHFTLPSPYPLFIISIFNPTNHRLILEHYSFCKKSFFIIVFSKSPLKLSFCFSL